MSIIQGNAVGGEASYEISRSLRFNSADSAYLNRTPGSATNRDTLTLSLWHKRSALGSLEIICQQGADTNNASSLIFNSSNQLEYNHVDSGSTTDQCITSAVFRDIGAWYHIVLAIDTTQATEANRIKIYVNNVQQTLGTANYPAQNVDTDFNTTNVFRIGSQVSGTPFYLNGYLTEVNFIDGSALTPSDFGETDPDTGVWKPKKYTGTYGTNGFYLNFSDNSGTTSTTLGKDSSGNGNNWTPNNFSVTAGAGNDSLVDTPTAYGSDTGAGGEVRGNYATLNPLAFGYTNYTSTISDGNLQIYAQTYGGANSRTYGSTFGASTGKWYFEVDTVLVSGSGNNIMFGWSKDPVGSSNQLFAQNRNCIGIWVGYSGSTITRKYSDSTAFTEITGASTTNGDRIMIAVDFDAGKAWLGKNGSWWNASNTLTTFDSSSPTITFTPNGQTYTPIFEPVGAQFDTNRSGLIANFGQRPFAYTAPSGFKALCTTNLPTPTIGATSSTQANKYFDVVTRAGTSAIASVSSLLFQPDFAWIKNRNNTAGHSLFDAVRGVSAGAAPLLQTQATTAEVDFNGTVGNRTLTSFDTNGYTLGADGTAWTVNQTGRTYVDWLWKANGAGSSNTAGTITSTVSANTTAGFSIVSFTTNNTAGATVGHGLGVAPSMIIMKYRGLVANWVVYHKDMNATPQNGYLNLNTTAAFATLTDPWNNTAPSSSVITMGAGVGSSGSTNYGTYTSVAYCFSEVPGYSAFGSYTGNGSTDGPFVFTNHRPAFLLVKRTDTTSNWTILDFTRIGYNVDNNPLYPNLSDQEATTDLADLLSNGFKLRSTDASVNANTGTYIYMSLASNPFKYSLGR